MKKVFYGIFLFIFALGFLGCSQAGQETENKSNNNTEVVAESEKISLKTYDNQSGKFSIKYPADYTLKETTGDQIYVSFSKNDTEIFGVRVNKAEKEIPYYFDNEPNGNTKLGNFDAKQYNFPNGYCDGPSCSEPFIAIQAFQNQQEYAIEFYNIRELSGTHQEILKSFRLLEK